MTLPLLVVATPGWELIQVSPLTEMGTPCVSTAVGASRLLLLLCSESELLPVLEATTERACTGQV